MANNVQRTGIAALVLSAAGLVHIATREGYVAVAMVPVPGDVPTIGFGTTQGVKLGDKITPPKALERSLSDIAKYEGAVKQCVTAPLYQREYDAYISLAYNIGPVRFCASTIPAKLAAGQYQAACETILDFDGFRDRTKPMVKNPKTGRMEFPLIRLRGLTTRRQSEYRMCLGPQA